MRGETQDYFIFSSAALGDVANETQAAVIGRMQIDNFLMGMVRGRQTQGELVDATTASRDDWGDEGQLWASTRDAKGSTSATCRCRGGKIAAGTTE